ncbi:MULTISPECIES: hypothetical protein [Streptomyces]|uniref:C2H2-type domain-containing protein n=1 Tax=Streptomyces lasiicapitis TaxID=1923961 RepID=A0ABQ2MPP0_9ACTN|nr:MULTISPECIES: hypothetical protein [Streptomyces]QIB45299.1 hypothetical protein G3H79_21725 [Streptomyces aureoverticillatus]GGO55870.1 hypothetical protein GCM10012286_69010 [Streptomyces lasiicapitis]
MSEIADTGHRTAAAKVVEESYAFACMRCGHGWEQTYEIEHHVDAKGQEFVMYLADGHHVPSPLTRPTCLNCGGHVVRIMRAGQVSSVRSALESMHRRQAAERVARAGEAAAAADDEAGEPKPHHHWHLSDLLHPFHRKAG